MVFKLDSRQCNHSASNANVFVSFSQAKVNIIAGCCMAMGLRFAGSANLQAFNCLVSLFALLYFLSYKYQCVHLYFTKQNVPKNGSMNRSEHCNGKIMFSACEKLNNCSHACRNLTTLYCMLVWCSSVSKFFEHPYIAYVQLHPLPDEGKTERGSFLRRGEGAATRRLTLHLSRHISSCACKQQWRSNVLVPLL